MTQNQIMLFALTGAAIQEIIYLYELRKSLADPQNNFLKSPGYWIITIIMMAASAFGASVFLKGTNPTQILCLVVGAAFPAFFKLLIKTFLEKQQAPKKMLPGTQHDFVWKDYFRG